MRPNYFFDALRFRRLEVDSEMFHNDKFRDRGSSRETSSI